MSAVWGFISRIFGRIIYNVSKFLKLKFATIKCWRGRIWLLFAYDGATIGSVNFGLHNACLSPMEYYAERFRGNDAGRRINT